MPVGSFFEFGELRSFCEEVEEGTVEVFDGVPKLGNGCFLEEGVLLLKVWDQIV